MPDEKPKPTHRPYSKWRFALPFGHYEASGEQEPPADEVLIGREGQRAYLIDLLLNMGRRGAYLVTGRRGAGKTSFVRHCIGEYRAEVFSRFVRSTVGHTLFWDKTLLGCLTFGCLLSLLLLSEFLALLLHGIHIAELAPGPEIVSRSTLFSWFLVVPIAILCAYPFIYAKELLEVVVAAFRQEASREDQWASVTGLLGLIPFALLAWWCDLLQEAASTTLSRLLVTICLIYMMVNLISFRRLPADGKQASEGSARAKWIRVAPRALFMVAPAAAFWIPSIPTSIVSDLARSRLFLACALMYFAGGSAARFFMLISTPITELNEHPVDGYSDSMKNGPLLARRDSAWWYLVLAFFPGAAAIATLIHESLLYSKPESQYCRLSS